MARHPADLVGYLYAADLYCAGCLIDRLVREGRVNPRGPLLNRDKVEVLLENLARIERIDRGREDTFDSGDFPKALLQQDLHTVAHCQQAADEGSDLVPDRCCDCGELLEDELPLTAATRSKNAPPTVPLMDPEITPGSCS